MSKYGIPSAKSIYIRKGEDINHNEIISTLGLPLFVKPNQSGSSLGISKVKEASDLQNAIEIAFKEDNEILIESFLNGTEVSVGVLDYKGETIVLGITEIVPKNEFFDYEAKYNGASEEITPARLDDATRLKVEEISKRAYDSLGMSGFSRSEYIIMDGIPYMLEMNTNPGFSPASILPQQAKIYGISIKDLCGNEVEKAFEKKIKIMKIAVFPGSFDPITLGHYDIIERAAPLFDKLIIAIGQNSQKKYMFSPEKRMEFIQNSVAEFPNVEVDFFEGLTVDYCFEKKCSVHYPWIKKSCRFRI